MDIVVTIPKSEYKNDDRETKEMIEKNYIQFWSLSKTPKKLKIGDRIYFVKNKQIESSMKVIEIETNSVKKCETTERLWVGNCQISMDNLRNETHLKLCVKGFQGFRYKWW